MEPGHVPQQVVKAAPRHPAGGVHVHPGEGLHDLGVVGDLKVGDYRLSEALHLHIGGVVRANGHGGVDDVWDDQHDFPNFLRQFPLLGLQRGQSVGVGLHLGFGLLRLRQLGGVLFGLAHEHPHLLAQGVADGAQVVGLRHGGPVLRVQGQHLVHQRELLLLEFFADVFLYRLGILPDKTNIKHRFLSPSKFIQSNIEVLLFHVKQGAI